MANESYIEVTEGSGKKVSTVDMTIGGQTVYLERDVLGIGVITLPGTPQLNAETSTGTYPVSPIDIQGRFNIVIKNTFNDANAYAGYRIKFLDDAGVSIGFSEYISISNLGILESSRYYGENVVYTNDFGAEAIQIYLETLSASDNISCYVAVC